MVHSSTHNLLFNRKSGGLNKKVDFFKLLNEKKSFLAKTFGNLIFQLLVTFIIAFQVKSPDLLENNLYFWGLIITTFIIIFLLAMVSMPPIMKFILFTIFSICWGLLLSKIKEQTSPEIIKSALLGVISIFIAMFTVGLLITSMGITMSPRFGFILLVALILLIIVSIVSMFMKSYDTYHKAISVFALVLFSIFIIYDTNTILQRNYLGDFITASIDYYLDTLNIFINLINIQS
jgi:FtsH-binding integral membrane protein